MIGIAGLIDEFLLQSVGNKIRLFPCWPANQNASFTGLRAQGGFVVSAGFKDGQVTSATIESSAGRELCLLSPWKTVYVNGRKCDIAASGLVTMQTKKGQVFRFTPSPRS
jgi:alpha-L-fucosidase 2